MKIRVVQIAVAASNDDTWETLLLDSQGHVWHEVPQRIESEKTLSTGKRVKTVNYVGKWEQIELPEAPMEDTP